MGMLYGLMAIALLLIIKAVGVLNFAHGQLFMLGGYIFWTFSEQLNMPYLASMILSIVAFSIVAFLYMNSVYWPLRNSPWKAAVTISTIGASIALKEIVRLIWGAVPLTMAPIVDKTVKVGNVYLHSQYLFIIGISALIMIIVYILFEKTFLGTIMQATSQDRYASEIIGVPTKIAILSTYIISITISGIGGSLAAPLFLVSQSLGSFASKAFAGIVLGGLGNIPGAVVGCIVIGLVESFSILITDRYKDAIVFAIVIIVLVLNPNGLFGKNSGNLDKA